MSKATTTTACVARELELYVNGAADADVRERIAAHLQSCSRCLRRLGELRLGEVPTAPASVWAAVAAADPLTAARRQIGVERGRKRVRVALAAAVVAAVGWLALGGWGDSVPAGGPVVAQQAAGVEKVRAASKVVVTSGRD